MKFTADEDAVFLPPAPLRLDGDATILEPRLGVVVGRCESDGKGATC